MTISPIEAAWSEGKLVLIAIPSEGPDVGRHIACITNRSAFVRLDPIRKALRSRRFLRSLREDIRRQILAGIGDLTPENDANFMDDLALLMGVHLIIGDAAVTGTGLFSIVMALSPDTTLPWDRRGFVTEADSRKPDLVGRFF